MPGVIKYRVIDYSGEKASIRFPIPSITEVNYPSVVGALIPAMNSALLDIIMGPEIGIEVLGRRVYTGAALPVSEFAQRELKWLCKYQDVVTGKRYTVEIPTASASFLDPGSDNLDITADEGLALKNAFEAVVRSPKGNAVTLYQVRFVGRNL